MSEEPDIRSPFELTANLYAYVPREAMESCISSIVCALRNGERCIALTGPAGIGKTLILHMLGDRIGHELGFIYLPYAALPPDDLCAWALGRMALPQDGDPVEGLKAHARGLSEQGRGLLLLLDDASTMSLETARWIADLVDELDGALRLVVAVTDGPPVDPLFEALGPGLDCFRLDQPLTKREMIEYVESRLSVARAPKSTRSRFDEDTMSALFRASEGNPRQLHTIASAVIRGLPPAPIGSEQDAAGGFAPESGRKKKLRTRKKRKGVARRKRAPENESQHERPPETRPAAESQSSTEGQSEKTREAIDETAANAGIARVRDQREAPVEALDALRGPSKPAMAPPEGNPTEDLRAKPAPIQDRPRAVSLAPASRVRVFRTSLIVAAALVAMVLARPEVPLDFPSPNVVAPPPVVARIATDLPPLPAGVHSPQRREERVLRAPAARIGTFSVQVNATPWARIEVDGVDFGATPIANIPLLAGEHTFRARMADGRLLEKVVAVDEADRFVFFE